MNILENILEEVENLNYYPEGMGCGIEDCGITDRYEACEYGWDKAIEAVIEVINNMDDCEDINVPSNDGWIPVKERLPEDCEEIVLVQVSGKPADNILFDNAFELALYEKEEGWILDNYPKWKNPDVIAWCSLPELYRPKIVEKKHKNTQQEMEDFWNDR